MKVGTIPWLLRHDLRVRWRSSIFTPHVVAGVVAGVILTNIALSSSFIPTSTHNDVLVTIDNSGRTIVTIWLGFLLLALGPALLLTVEFAINKELSTHMYFLHTSPILRKRILSLILIKTGISCFCTSLIFLSCVTSSFPLFYKVDLKTITGIGITIALNSQIASAVALNLTLNLLPRVGKFLTLIMFGILGFLCCCLGALALITIHMLPYNFLSSHLLNKDSWFVLPFRTVLLDPLSVLLLLGATGIFFFLTIETQHHKINVCMQKIASQQLPRKNDLRFVQNSQYIHHFSGNYFFSLLINEWRCFKRSLISPRLWLLYVFLYLVCVSDYSISFLHHIFYDFHTDSGGHIAKIIQLYCLTAGPCAISAFFRNSVENNSDFYQTSPIYGAYGKKLYQFKLIAVFSTSCIYLLPFILVLATAYKPDEEYWYLALTIFLVSMVYCALIYLARQVYLSKSRNCRNDLDYIHQTWSPMFYQKQKEQGTIVRANYVNSFESIVLIVKMILTKIVHFIHLYGLWFFKELFVTASWPLLTYYILAEKTLIVGGIISALSGVLIYDLRLLYQVAQSCERA